MSDKKLFPTQVSDWNRAPRGAEMLFSNGRSFPIGSVDHLSSLHRNVTFEPTNVSGNLMRTKESYPTLEGHLEEFVRPAKPAKYPEYKGSKQRLDTFARWTISNPSSNILCDAGFFLTNDGDLVRCFQCGIGLKDFSSDDDPLLEHVRYSPNCSFLLSKLGSGEVSRIKDQAFSPTRPTSTNGSPYTEKHPEYSTFSARLSTFSKWPTQLLQTPHQLAEAGLFYTGFEDHVRCFSCDGGLKHWDPEDDPWTEHCRWFPQCPFVREQKGDEFITQVQAAVAFGNEEEIEVQRSEESAGLSEGINGLNIHDPNNSSLVKEHRSACLEMGFSDEQFLKAMENLIQSGNIRPTIDDVLYAIPREKSSINLSRKHETPLEENARLKSLLFCMKCGTGRVNALLLPCNHHRLCMECAEPLTACPICGRLIAKKVKTFLA